MTEASGGEPVTGDPTDRWETAELIAALDPRIAARMLAQHPAEGYCWRCRTDAPCSSRILGQAVNRAALRRMNPG
ncbi:hypothetical protein [Pseudonocardia acaciae]|uniref:hypothetical protein n=1 Tax=Pseudonocardia acaciae TaxID=551276 RepID=UPI00056770FC|nr:hypothetical protein [Pseudonocardia acaciae]